MIELKNVTKQFGIKTALSQINLTIDDGNVYGITGSNGAGKSTLLRVMAGVYRPEQGTVLYDGEPVWTNPMVKAQYAYVPDIIWFPAKRNLRDMAGFYEDFYPTFSMEKFEDLVSRLKLDTRENLNLFSKGMKRQAAMVLAIARRPKYYFLDEAMEGLDLMMREAVKRELFNDIWERKATAVIVGHSLHEMENTCDRLALLHNGGLILESDVESMKTSRVKVQVAFREPVTREQLEAAVGQSCLSFSAEGRVVQAILAQNDGDREKLEASLAQLSPVMTEVLPLGLEEYFLYEMREQGYSAELQEEKGGWE